MIFHIRYRKELYLLNHVDPFQSHEFRVNNIYSKLLQMIVKYIFDMM